MRLAVKKEVISNVLEATILTGFLKGEDLLISRIHMNLMDVQFKFKKLQFSILLEFAIFINEAQGQF